MEREHVPGVDRQRVREGGRSARVRGAVSDAVLSLLAEGRVEFSMVEVAERAGVSRKTLYRWWPTHDDLLVEALSQHVRRLPVPSTGGWEGDVRAFAHALAEFAADPVEVATGALLVGRRFPEFARLVMEHYRPVRDAWRELVELGVEAGEVNPSLDPEIVVNTLVAPLFMAPLTTGRSMRHDEVDALVDVILAATRSR